MTPSQRNRDNRERWLVSYADFITLLFAFFVVLYAFSRADQRKQAQVAAAITNAFHTMGLSESPVRAPDESVRPGKRDSAQTDSLSDRDTADVSMSRSVQEDLDLVQHNLEVQLSDQLAARVMAIQMTPDGLVISLREAGFFNSGSANPKPETEATVRTIAASLEKIRLSIRVEGHTDSLPIHGPAFDSNWELSSARATRIARMLVEQDGISPDRVSAAGYAAYRPTASNATPEGRAANRRVDLVILPRIRWHYDVLGKVPSATWRRVTDN